jgi:hypothetical protein
LSEEWDGGFFVLVKSSKIVENYQKIVENYQKIVENC